jgi:hypothetical protein
MSIQIKLKGRRSAMSSLRKEVRRKGELGVQKRKLKLLSELRDATPVDTGEARDGWSLSPFGIYNNVDHISRLNTGSSKQAPAFFIEKILLTHRDVSPSGIIVKHQMTLPR